MPSSAPDHIPAVLKHVMALKPKSVLDVGIGYGKWGFLLREYLESWNDRVHPDSWEVTITGIEVWESYTELPWIREVYTNMFLQDVRSWCVDHHESLRFDVAIAGDVLEHMPKEDALKVLDHLLDICKTVIVNVPIGEAWLNNQIIDGNPYEKHQSAWGKYELANFKNADSRIIHEYQVSRGKDVATFALSRKPKSVPVPEPSVQPDCTNKRTILHVHNVQRCGGTGNFVWDFARTFPEFNHVALCVNDPTGDPEWVNWVSHNMRPLYAPKLTQKIVDDVDPVCVILHNTAGKSVDSDHHLGILNGRYTVFLHHNPTHPLFQTNVDVDVFVSGSVISKYTSIVGRMKLVKQIPPCVYGIEDYTKLELPDFGELKFTGAGKAGKEAISAFTKLPVHVDPGPKKRGMNVMPGYLSRFNAAIIWSGLEESWCRTASECLAAGMIVIAHDYGALREQITHGVNGYLFDTYEDLLQLVRDLQFHVSRSDLIAMSASAKEWALHEVGPDRLKRDWYPLLTQALMRS